ncbi:transaldolase [Rhodanobacter sp. 115]|jgi:transaldolase|uniref:transaldolase n=1 Tax=Rhodanobacter sp. FW021-MT20 TaxID=1162282 RepID=UPI000260E3E5|nr:transaldolase [Rhodanobacter sp. 115]EIL88044.1 transaldolase [Rhodanobacter sp. 115]
MHDSARTLNGLGQSLWLDNITRGLLRAGTLEDYRDRCAVTGLTSNPTIFEHAIKGGDDYDAAIRADASTDPEAVFFDLAIDDLRNAAKVFEPIHQRTSGVDGWVSLEVSPLLADDTAHTIEQAVALHERAGIANLYIKVPGTTAGAGAIEELIYRGVPINVTLLFSPKQYQAVADAYMKGLERRLAEGLSLDVASVASVFISRWDVKVAKAVPEEMHNQLGLAVAGSIYARYRDVLASPRMQRLMNEGARPQRLLWASTGTKDPAASDTLYVDSLAAPFTVNTIPEKTLLAVVDHGQPGALMSADDSAARAVQASFAERGLEVDPLAETLQDEGAASFVKSWNDLLDTIRQRMEKAA